MSRILSLRRRGGSPRRRAITTRWFVDLRRQRLRRALDTIGVTISSLLVAGRRSQRQRLVFTPLLFWYAENRFVAFISLELAFIADEFLVIGRG